MDSPHRPPPLFLARGNRLLERPPASISQRACRKAQQFTGWISTGVPGDLCQPGMYRMKPNAGR